MNTTDHIREQAVGLLVTIEHMPSFTTEQGIGSFGLLVSVVGRALQLASNGEREHAHRLIKGVSNKIPSIFEDATERIVVQRAFDDFALVLNVPPNDIAH